jgi:glutamate decarboxylase
MVHLQPVRKSTLVESPRFLKRVQTIALEEPHEHDFYSSVYGSRFAAEDLPRDEMPEKEMPREVAYRMIKDDLSLDGNPLLKWVS